MKNSRPVYSTEAGRLCPGCGRAVDQCECQTGRFNDTGDDIIRISRETKGRKGKGVTLITGVRGTEDELKAMAKSLKQMCGTGGTVRNGIIEIQGDVRQKIYNVLDKTGQPVKLVGG